MKFAYQQLTAHLKKNLLPIYLLAGNEIFLMQEARDAIRFAAKKQGFSEIERFDINKDFDWNKLTESANLLSLFSEKIFTEIKLTQKPNAQSAKIFLSYIEKNHSDKIILISTEKLDSATQKSSWVEAINKLGAVITIWPLEPTQLKQWTLARLEQNNLFCDPDGVQFIIDQTEGNLLALAQEIEKLTLIFNGHISTNDLIQTITDNARYDIFNFVDIILQGKESRISRVLKKLKEESVEATLILWALTREIRHIINVRADIKKNIPWEVITKKNQIWEKKQPLIKRAIKLHTSSSLDQLLLHANKIDFMIKGVEPGNVWNELERLAINLAAPVALSS